MINERSELIIETYILGGIYVKRYDDAKWRDGMKLRLDYNNMLADFVGNDGFTVPELNAHKTKFEAATRGLTRSGPRAGSNGRTCPIPRMRS